MAKVHVFSSQDGGEQNAVFHCPGCGYSHPYRIKSDDGLPVWSWNGDLEKPTFRPSLLVNKGHVAKNDPVCHLFMTDGMIEFCHDSEHALAGQTVECPDWDDRKGL